MGIIAYELIYGHRPYTAKSRKELKQIIVSTQASIKYDELPDGYSYEAANFINNLIQRKPNQRLGSKGINELINHPWFKNSSNEPLADFHFDPIFLTKYMHHSILKKIVQI